MIEGSYSRRDFLKAAGLGAVAVTVTGCMSENFLEAGKNRPNILIVMTDQQRYDSTGSYGCKAAHTPNLDRLAREGVLFENCYVSNPRLHAEPGQYDDRKNSARTRSLSAV